MECHRPYKMLVPFLVKPLIQLPSAHLHWNSQMPVDVSKLPHCP
uniref:GLTB n=1 Tax=Arundo donax TaxID=35708 RepID=A0A0A9CPD8_ARUDO